MNKLFPNVIVILVCLGAVAVGAGVGYLATPDGTPITSQRSFQATSPLTVANGDGSAGNTTYAMQSSPVFAGTTEVGGLTNSGGYMGKGTFTNLNATFVLSTLPGSGSNVVQDVNGQFRLAAVAGGGSQTPWSADVYGAGYALLGPSGLWLSNSVNPFQLSWTNGFAQLAATNVQGFATNVGFSLTNAQPALVGVQMESPSIFLWGNGWKTTATAGTQPVGVSMTLEPLQGTTTPMGNFSLRFATNGTSFPSSASAPPKWSIKSDGTITNFGHTYIPSPNGITALDNNSASTLGGLTLNGTLLFNASQLIRVSTGDLKFSDQNDAPMHSFSFRRNPTNAVLGMIFTNSSLQLVGGDLIPSSTNHLYIPGSLFVTNGIGSWATNIVASANANGATNSTAYVQVFNIYGTSGSIVFWNRSGLNGSTVAGTSLWTNTVSVTGADYIVGPNCGIQVTSPVGVILTQRAF